MKLPLMQKKKPTTAKKKATASVSKKKKKNTPKRTNKTKKEILHTAEEMPTSAAELTALFTPQDDEKKAATQSHYPDSKIVNKTRTPHKKRRRWLYAAMALVILGIASFVLLRVRLKKTLVPEEGAAVVQGITANVTISRDDLGVPHIKAENLDDMAFGAGFAMAADRNFQLEFLRRMAYGRLSEVLGKDTLGLDIYMRSLGFGRLATQNYTNLDTKMRQMLKAFAAGVNAERKAFPKREFEFMLLRLSPEEWQPQDSLALYQLFSFLLATNSVEEMAFLKLAAKLGPEKAAWLFPIYDDEPLPFEEVNQLKGVDWQKFKNIDATKKAFLDRVNPTLALNTLLPEPSLPASNNWAIAPARTKNGKTLIANDTHLQMTVPAMWYMMNLECPEYRAAGVALPGTPIVALGTNGTLAWGATMVMGDNQDIFLEQLREKNGKTQYLYKGKWLDAKITHEKIQVKGENTYNFKRTETEHGVLLNEALSHAMPDKYLAVRLESEYGIAYSTTVDEEESTLRGFYNMAKARTMKEARTALDKVTGIYLNIVYGDEKNIGWLATGRYPARTGKTGQLPRIGWTGDNDWDGYYLPSENPSKVNPPEGFIATANHRVWGPDAETDLWISASWYSADRADRAKELIRKSGKLTAEDMTRIQADTVSLTAKRIKVLLFSPGFHGELQAAVNKLPALQKKQAEEALAFFQNFDGNLDKNSAAAAVYENFADAVAKLAFADELSGQDSSWWITFQVANKRSYNAVHDHLLGRSDSPFWDNLQTPEKETKATIFAQALAAAIAANENSMGTNRNDWAWGKIHQYYWKHQFTQKAGFLKGYLNRGPIPAGGDMQTLNQAGNLWGDSHNVWLIPAMRFIIDFSKQEPASLIVHMGISGNPESPHYADMIPLFTDVKNWPLPLEPIQALKQYSRHFVLTKE